MATRAALPGRRSLPGVAATVAATVCWGLSAIFVDLARMGTVQLAFFRLWVGVAFMAVLLVLTRRVPSRAVLVRCLPGGLLLCGDILGFFGALALTSVAEATVISALQPVLVLAVAGPWFGEKVGRREAALTAAAIAGVVLVVTGSGGYAPHAALGAAAATGSLVCWTGYWIVSKRVAAGVNAVEYTSGVIVTAAVLMTPVALLAGHGVGSIRARDWLWVGLLAVVPGTGHILINWAHRFVDVSVSSVIGAANPIVAAVAALLVLGQPLAPLQIAGGLLAIAAIAAVAGRSGPAVRPGSAAGPELPG
ncbi:MAG: DMT family transporter [Acidimicrobiales bacterium]